MTVSAADWPSEYYKVTKLIHALCVLFNHLRTRVWTKQLKKKAKRGIAPVSAVGASFITIKRCQI